MCSGMRLSFNRLMYLILPKNITYHKWTLSRLVQLPCFYYSYFLSYCSQTGSWHWKLIPMFMTVLLVAINHKPWNPTVLSFNSLKTWCIIWPDAEVKNCTACVGCNQKQGVPNRHVSSCIYFYFYACIVLLLLLYVKFMKNLLLTDSVCENFEFSTTWMLRIQVFWVVTLAN